MLLALGICPCLSTVADLTKQLNITGIKGSAAFLQGLDVVNVQLDFVRC